MRYGVFDEQRLVIEAGTERVIRSKNLPAFITTNARIESDQLLAGGGSRCYETLGNRLAVHIPSFGEEGPGDDPTSG